MKAVFILLSVLVLNLLGCGPNKSALPRTQASATAESQNIFSSSSSNCTAMQGTIITPAAGLVGAVTTIQYGNHTYLMSPNSNQTSKNFVYAVPAGQTLGICFSGSFTTQNGMFPNPTVFFDVVVLTSISFL